MEKSNPIEKTIYFLQWSEKMQEKITLKYFRHTIMN